MFLTIASGYVAQAALVIPGLYNTGVDANGLVLPIGSVERHYAVSGASQIAYVVPEVFHPNGSRAWITAPAGAAWIGPNATSSTYPNDPGGDYSYSIQILLDLTGYNPSQLQIAGRWATDNSGQIWVNNHYSGFNTGEVGFTGLSPFLLQTDFVLGMNVIEFRVVNGSGPSGLLVSDLVAEIDGSLTLPPGIPPAPVPEPSTYLAGGLLLIPFGMTTLLRWRRKQVA